MRAKKELVVGGLFAFLLAACGGTDAAPPVEMTEDPDVAPAGETMGMPMGYEVRLDAADASAADFHVMEMGGGMHFETGPAGVFYDASSMVESGNYSVSGSFTEIGAPPNHREAYGIVIGGSDLQGEAQKYSYFLVRPTGHYLIKRRMGAETMNVGEGWVESDAVNKAPESGGDVMNVLGVTVEGDQVHFMVNGTEVATVPASELDVYGVVGIRINHNLNVMVGDWALTRN